MRFVTALGIVLLALAAMMPAAAQQRPLDRLRGLEGVWRYADGSDGVRRIDEAVARAVDEMPFFLEGIAAGKIRGRIHANHRVTFRIEGDRVSMSADDWGPVSSRIGGPAVNIVGPDGDRLRFTQRVVRGRLQQRYWHPDGQRDNEFSLSGDGQWLWMSTAVSSPQIPDVARFRLRYRRASPVPSIVAQGGAPRGEEHAALDPRTQQPLPR